MTARDDTILRLAAAVAARALRAWGGYLRTRPDEAYSEALVAAVEAAQRYPGQIDGVSWTPSVAREAYNRLVGGLKRSGYLPGRHYQPLITNLEVDVEE
jgi:hypothetical protein